MLLALTALAIGLGILVFADSAKALPPSTITVIGTDKYPKDVRAVQKAVDTYDIVKLSGRFNFGQATLEFDPDTGEYIGTPAGMVSIRRENVTLEADATGATISGGGAPIYAPPNPYTWTWWMTLPAIAVYAPGVTVRGLTMEGSIDGIFVSAAAGTPSASGPTTIENNFVHPQAWGIFVVGTPGAQSAPNAPVVIEGNVVTTPDIAFYSILTGGWPLVVRNNTLTAGGAGVVPDWAGYALDQNMELVQALTPVDIVNNNITVGNKLQFDGICVMGWVVWDDNENPPPADWGDNGPVNITGNTVTMNNLWGTAISIGRSAQGLNHCFVANNTIKGHSGDGIDKWPYGHDNWILENDLSGLTSEYQQIGVLAGGTIVRQNVLGIALLPPPLLFFSVNIHPPFTPMPLPLQNCSVVDNEYRGTGCSGWSQDNGCILLASDVDLGWNTGEGTEVRNNLVSEIGRFPQGTGGPSNQVLEIKIGPNPLVHDNRIVGLPANFISDPSIGQRLKNARLHFAEERTKLDLKRAMRGPKR